MTGLFHYPDQARFDRIIPKAKIYEYAKLKPPQRVQFSALVRQIRWAYKLAPETTNLPASGDISEIQIIRIRLTERDFPDGFLRLIDSAIPSAVIFELLYGDQIMVKAAHKQRQIAHAARPLLSGYFSSKWLDADISRLDLPHSLNLAILYDKMLSGLINPDARGNDGLSLADKVANREAISAKEAEISKISRKVQSIKQFNKQVAANRALKKAKSDLERLNKILICPESDNNE